MDTKLDAFDDDLNYLKGLGGWLIIVGIGITISPLITSYQLYSLYIPIFQDGSFAMLTNPAYTTYIPNFEVLLYAEIALNILMTLVGLYLIYLFFTKHRYFPKLYIALAIFYPLFLLADTVAVSYIIPDTNTFDMETVRQLTQSIIAAAIWIPYMLVSERVKKTFTRPQNDRIDTAPAIIGEA